MLVLPGQVLGAWRPEMATSGSAQLPVEASLPSRVSTTLVTKPAPRHSALVRVTHWITTLCFLALLVSGIEIVISHPRFYWGETGNVLTTPLFQLPIPSSRRLVPTGYNYVLPDQNGWTGHRHHGPPPRMHTEPKCRASHHVVPKQFIMVSSIKFVRRTKAYSLDHAKAA